jgi:GntR family transcriptional regulator
MSEQMTSAGATDPVTSLLSEMLSHSDRRPLVDRITATMVDAITSGTLSPGIVLPREPDLAKALGLSRQTVGRALSEVARRGLLVRRRGIGTFVANAPAVEQPLGRLSSFIHTLALDGTPPAARLIGVRLTTDPTLAATLTGDANAVIWEIGRLFAVGGEPFALEWIYLTQACGERLPGDRLADGVIDDLLQEFCGITIDHGEETLSLTALDRTAAAFLHQVPGAPAFLIVRTASVGDRVVEIRRRLIRGDRARFRLELPGPDQTSQLNALTVEAIDES